MTSKRAVTLGGCAILLGLLMSRPSLQALLKGRWQDWLEPWSLIITILISLCVVLALYSSLLGYVTKFAIVGAILGYLYAIWLTLIPKIATVTIPCGGVLGFMIGVLYVKYLRRKDHSAHRQVL